MAGPTLNPSGGRRWPRRAACAAVVTAAAVLRFHALDRQGLLLFDEGQLILEARTVTGIARGWAGTRAVAPYGIGPARRVLAERVAASRILFAKPLHNGLLALTMATGRRADQAAFLLAAVSGTLTVALVCGLAARWYGGTAAVLAGVALAVSPYHLLYSRSGLADALTACLLTLSFTAWHSGPGPWAAAASGLAAGCGLASNYRVLFLPAIFAAMAMAGPSPSGRAAARRLIPWLAGLVMPLAAVELAYRTCAAPGVWPGGTYLAQLKTLLALHGGQGFLFRGWSAFGWYTHRWEGAPALLVLVVALSAQLVHWRGPDLTLNLWWGVPWLVFSAYWDNAPRFFVLLLPPLAVIKGRWLAAAAGRATGWGRPLAVALAAAAALAALPGVPAVVPRPTPYLEAATLLATSGRPFHVSTNERLGSAYFGPGSTAALPATPAEAGSLARHGWRWAVTDLQAWFGGVDRPEARLSTAAWLGERCPTLLAVPYSPIALTQLVFEQDLTFADARRMLEDLAPRAPALRVLDLAPLAGGTPR